MNRLLRRNLFAGFRIATGAAIELAFSLSYLLGFVLESARLARWWLLPQVATNRLTIGLERSAERLAREALSRASELPEDSGDAIHHGNLVLGRLAIRRGDVDAAVAHLLAAGQTLGSPTLCSFGPNMKLAAELLEHGRRDAVLNYLELCRDFWELPYGKLDEWGNAIRRGETPRFGANLYY